MTKRIGAENGFYGVFHKSKQSIDERDPSGQKTKQAVEWFESYGRDVRIKKIIDIFEASDVYWVLKCDSNGIPKQVKISRGDLKKNILLEYAKKGMDVFEHTVGTLIKWLQKQERYVKPTMGHEHIGFDIYTDENGTEHDVFKHSVGYGFKSEYLGGLTINATGNINEYRDFINEYIAGTPLELGIALGLVGLLDCFRVGRVACWFYRCRGRM